MCKNVGSIGIFCGSSQGGNPIYKNHTENLADILCRHNLRMIYGGGNIGLMGILADQMLSQGGSVIGIMPDFLAQKEISHQNIEKMYYTQSMSERKNLLIQLSDAFIALPGGLGTLDELTEVLTHFQLELSNKVVALLNTNGFFDHFIKQLDHAVKEKFLKEAHRNNIIIANNPEEVIHKIMNFAAERINPDWVEKLKSNNTY